MAQLKYLIFITLICMMKSEYLVNNYSFVSIAMNAEQINPFQQLPPSKKDNSRFNTFAHVHTKIRIVNKRFEFYTEPLKIVYEPISKILSTQVREDILDPADANTFYMAPPGIQAYVDWVILHPEGILGIFGHTLIPHTMYVSVGMIEYFVREVFPLLHHPFVLLTGGNDRTIPLNVDLRLYPSDINKEMRDNIAFIASGHNYTLTPNLDLGDGLLNITYEYNKLIESPLLVHWYAENHMLSNPRVSILPIGSIGVINEIIDKRPAPKPLSSRIPKIVIGDKIHDDGYQFSDIRATATACINRPDICFAMNSNLTGAITIIYDWLDYVANHQFIIITHGGGLDPCPKLFEAMYLGTIPILQKTALALDSSYSKLFPIVYVDNIVDFLSWKNASKVLQIWLAEKAPYFEVGSKLRNKTIERLTTKYWYHKFITNILWHHRLSVHNHGKRNNSTPVQFNNK